MNAKTSIKECDVGLTPIVKLLKGTFYAPKKLDYKKELIIILAEKYLN